MSTSIRTIASHRREGVGAAATGPGAALAAAGSSGPVPGPGAQPSHAPASTSANIARRRRRARPRTPFRCLASGPTRALAFAVLASAGLLGSVAPAVGAGDEEPWARLRPLRGEDSHAFVTPGQTLHDVALAYRVGFEAVQRLNPDLDPWVPPAGSVVHLPTRYVLPEAESVGLVINVPEMRLYDFTSAEEVRVYPVSVGDPDDPTPIGDFAIGEKRTDPTWHVPESIRTEKPWLPKEVPPGPDNPLGSRWMTLGGTSYGIHGTNVRWSIGRIATHGCIRLYEPDMQDLYARVSRGTRVRVIYQPYKWGTDGRNLFLEAHPDIYGRAPDRLASALALPHELSLLEAIDLERVWRIVEQQRGVPEYAGFLP